MNKTLAIAAITLVAVVMGMSTVAPALADPSSGEKDNACAKEKNSKSNASSAVGCGDKDGDGTADRYDDTFDCEVGYIEDPDNPETCIPEDLPCSVSSSVHDVRIDC